MTDAHGVARDQLRAFIERIERLEEEKKTIADDIKDVKAEAKGCGFDVSIINAVLKLRKIDANERAERDAMLDTYLIALGMLPESVGDEESYDSETGEVTIIDREDTDGNRIRVTVDPNIAAILSRQPAAPLRSCADEDVINSEMDRATEGSFETGSEAAEKGREAIPAGPEGVDLNHAGASESLATDQPLKGGDEDPRAMGDPTSKTGEGAASALPAKPKFHLRPNCLDRSNCKSGSVDHCWSCKKAMAEKSEVAA